jgi:hypothetical protein
VVNSLPRGSDTKERHTEDTERVLAKFADKLNQIKMAEFDKSAATVTPQIINMTGSVDKGLNEIQVVFSQIVDELVSAKYELVEKEHELAGMKKLRPMSGLNVMVKIDQTPVSDETTKETMLLEKEEALNGKESALQVKEVALASREQEVSGKERALAQKAERIAASQREIDELKTKITQDEVKIKDERQTLSASRKKERPMSVKSGVVVVEKAQELDNGLSAEAVASALLRAEEKFKVTEEKYNEMQKIYRQLEFKSNTNTAESQKQIE